MEDNQRTKITIGTFKGKPVSVDTYNSANQHMLVTGSSGSGKTNFLKVWTSQNTERNTIVLDYSDSFPEFANAYKINISETQEIQRFFDKLSLDSISVLADAIKGALRLGDAQKTAVVNALRIMMSAEHRKSAVGDAREDIFYKYIEDEGDKPCWALFALILNTRCGEKGEQIAMRLLDLVITVSKYKNQISTMQNKKIVVVRFPVECCGLNSQLVELYLWRFWVRQLELRKPVTIVLDECQDLVWKKGSIADKILTQGRKFQIGMILSTQFLDSNFPKRELNIFTQSGLRVIFLPPDNEVREVAKFVDPTSWKNWVRNLRNLRVGQCVVSGIICVDERTSKQKLIVNVPEFKSESFEKEK
mgnify:CR=1 FL=1